MANHVRALKPGQTQFRRAAFCLRMLGLVMVVTFVSAVCVGIPFPGLWNAVFVPTLIFVPAVLIMFIAWFVIRWAWFRLKARHYGALLKMRTEAEYK